MPIDENMNVTVNKPYSKDLPFILFMYIQTYVLFALCYD